MNDHFDGLKFCREAAALVDLWLELPRANGSLCPSKSDFTPMKMGQHLRSVVLYERLEGGDIIARVAGSSIENFLGHDITGRNLFDIFPPEYLRAYHNYFLNLVEFPCAGVVQRPIHGTGGAAHLVKSLQLPMTDHSGRVSYLIGVAQHYPLPKHFTDYRGAAMTASRNLDIAYYDIGSGVPEHMETTMARGI